MPSRTSNKNLKKLPPLPAPQGRICIPVFVPDQVEWVALFLGALYELSLQSKFDRDEAHSAKAVAAVWWEIWRDTVEFLRQGGTCGDMAMPLSWRFTQDCGLEYSTDGETWVAVQGWDTYAPDCFAGEDGAPGQDGRDPEIRMAVVTESTRAVQWKYTVEDELAWRTAGLVHDGEDGAPGLPGQDGQDGQSVTSVTVDTLAAGAAATADYNAATGALVLGIPQGAPGDDGEDGAPGLPGADGQSVTEVIVTTLSYFDDVTVNYNAETGVLELGIPQGAPGEPGDCGCTETPQPAPDEDGKYCGMANGIVDSMTANFNDILDAVQAYGTVATAVNSLADTLYPVFILINGVSSVVQSILTVTVATINATLTQEAIDEAKCLLYCMFKEAGGWDSTVLTAWRDEVYANSGANVGLQEWVKTLNVYETPYWQRKAYIGSLESSDECLVCDCPEAETCAFFDFTTGTDFGWTIVDRPNSAPNWSAWAGDGWIRGTSTSTFQQSEAILIQKYLNTSITRVEIEVNTAMGGNGGIWLDWTNAAPVSVTQANVRLNMAGQTLLVYDFPAPQSVSFLNVGVHNDLTNTSTSRPYGGKLIKLRVYGTGGLIEGGEC